MEIEYEAKFLNIDKDEIRKRLDKIGAKLIKPEFMQKRFNFHLPGELRADGTWLRVRDEGDKTTLSLKKVDGKEIHNQKELCLEIDNFETGVNILESIGCEVRMYQETKRELWLLNDVEITIDTWPFLEPFIEVEADSEQKVKQAAGELGVDYAQAVFGPVGKVYKMKYGFSPTYFEGKEQRLIFEMENPFLKFAQQQNEN